MGRLHFKLKNKLPVICEKYPSKSVGITFTVNCGSVHDPKNKEGIAHVIEHLLFEGTKKRQTALAIAKEIEDVGGELNAYTSKTQTTYHFKVQKKYCKRALSILTDMMCHSTFEQLEKEKKIILREIMQGKEDPRHRQWIEFEKLLFDKDKAKNPVIGTKKSVMSITKSDLQKHHSLYYTTQNSVLTICGDVPKNIKLLLDGFLDLPTTKVPVEKKIVEKNKKKKKKITVSSLQQLYYIIGCKTPALPHKHSFGLELYETILSKGFSGWLYDEFRNKRGLVYDVRAINDLARRGSFFAINIIIEKKNLPKAKKILKEILTRIPTQREVQLAKIHLLAKYAFSMEDPDVYAQQLSEEFIDSYHYQQRIRATTLEDVKKAISWLSKQEFTECILE